MNQIGAAVARFHKILESDAHRDLAWAEQLRAKMQSERLTLGGRVICPFLRPNFITPRQYKALEKATAALISAIGRVEQLAVERPELMSQLEMLPAEKMLATLDPGYEMPAVVSPLDSSVDNGTLHFGERNADPVAGMAYGEALSSLFYDSPPVVEFRKRFPLKKLGGKKYLLEALLKVYKQYGGRQKPNIAIVEMRGPYQTGPSQENLVLQQDFQGAGYATEVVSLDQLDYRNGQLRAGNFVIDLVYRQMRVKDFLLRYDLSHPLVRAYADRKVCMVNSFRAEMAQKKALFALLTDAAITAKFPAEERHAIASSVPWTRLVKETKTSFKGEEVDLVDFIVKNRETLVLKPNDPGSEDPAVVGAQTDAAGWERALRLALRVPYVVQERVEPVKAVFPVFYYGEMQMREMQVHIHPHAHLGKVQSCSSWLTAVQNGTFSTISGMAPTFLLEGKS